MTVAFATTNDELDGGADLGQLHTHVVEDTRCYAVALTHEAEQQVLGPDVVMVEALGLFLGQLQDFAARSVNLSKGCDAIIEALPIAIARAMNGRCVTRFYPRIREREYQDVPLSKQSALIASIHIPILLPGCVRMGGRSLPLQAGTTGSVVRVNRDSCRGIIVSPDLVCLQMSPCRAPVLASVSSCISSAAMNPVKVDLQRTRSISSGANALLDANGLIDHCSKWMS